MRAKLPDREPPITNSRGTEIGVSVVNVSDVAYSEFGLRVDLGRQPEVESDSPPTIDRLTAEQARDLAHRLTEAADYVDPPAETVGGGCR